MLSEINIKKFLYLKNVEINLSEGLNVFTGETGVGKSLIIDAISFVLGERGRFEEGDFVELVFEDVNNEYTEDGVLILARQIKKGKNVYYLNGRRVTLSLLKEISEGLIEIHSQNHQQMLLKREYHRELLDSFAGIEKLIDEYRELFLEYKKLEREIEQLKEEQANRLRELDILKYQLSELESAGLKEGEKEELERRYEYLSNISFIKENIYNALKVLEENEYSITSQLSLFQKFIDKIAGFDKELESILENVETVNSILSDISYSLSKIDIDINPDELKLIEERLDKLNWLETKYNTDEAGLIKLIDEFKKRIEQLESMESKIPEIEVKRKKLYDRVIELAEEISKIRKEKSEMFSREIEKHIKDLALKNSVFITEIQEKNLDINGKDRVVFLFSANPGFPPKPLDKVASGGELSRLSLALKLVSNKSVDTMIFDEIDTGIGGKTGVLMAQKLKVLSDKFQIILITHLPQVAAVADKHFYIEKHTENGKTLASIKELSNSERELEIARMLSGIIDSSSLKLARNLIESFD